LYEKNNNIPKGLKKINRMIFKAYFYYLMKIKKFNRRCAISERSILTQALRFMIKDGKKKKEKHRS